MESKRLEELVVELMSARLEQFVQSLSPEEKEEVDSTRIKMATADTMIKDAFNKAQEEDADLKFAVLTGVIDVHKYCHYLVNRMLCNNFDKATEILTDLFAQAHHD